MTPNFGAQIYLKITDFWSWRWQIDNHQDHFARTILTIMVPLLIFLWYQYMEVYIRKGKTLLPPGPYGLPVVGYLPFLTFNLHERFTEMSHRYGPISSLRLGSKLHVVVNSVELAKVVTRDLDKTFANRSPPFTALTLSYGMLDVVWSNNNAHWRKMRKLMVSQVLSNANLDACAGFRTNEVRKVVRDVYGRIGKRIDINKVAFDAELNVVTGMLWGCSEENHSSYIGNGFREVEFKILELLGAPNISDFIPMLSWFDLQGRQREMQKQTEHLDRVFDKIIRGRINGGSRKVEEDGRKDFVQILLELKDKKDGPISIVEECHLSKLTYLDAVIKETFRIHPPLPLLIQRCANESCTVGGYMIPKGTIVHINVWAIHRDPRNCWEKNMPRSPARGEDVGVYISIALAFF
ncbi:cytochrome P450 [Cynara cardunculus var. scolymus]|uniref:Cytochrome P450 n=1 Tax=Cynara cardunculus var. scolymus TaxID=59895 RepID=A0A103XJS9_CYNCS|nr:cytochrome P450 [Cynara cardunculus var. scolymus]